MLTRLDNFLADAGVCSRRKAQDLMRAGLVFVNEKPAHLGKKINPEKDKVIYDKKIISPAKNQLIYYAFYKPKGVISTTSDEKGRKTVVDFLPRDVRLFPVGRLDENSEGLIILTNDGDLANQLTHPSFKHLKEYEVIVKALRKIDFDWLKGNFKKGITVDGIKMSADDVYNFKIKNNLVHFNIVLHTGLNHQIRKMCAAVHSETQNLKRIRVGKLKLEDLNLKIGEWKKINKNEII